MCHIHANAQQAQQPDTNPVAPTTPTTATKPPTTGSRRRRLWELDSRAHCPVVGVCLPVAALRRVVNKVFCGHNIDKEYTLHATSVGQCASRTQLAEGMQRELEKRYALAVRQAASFKTADALLSWWMQASQSDLAGALWATLTHPRCSTELAHQVLDEVHMLQHQVGAAQRADMKRMEVLLDENAVLARQLASAQQRHTQLAQDHLKRQSAQQTQLMQLRASLISRDTQLAALQAQLQQLEHAVPELACRFKQASEIACQAERIHVLEHALFMAQQESLRRGRLIEAQAVAFESRLGQANGYVQPVPVPELIPPSPQLDNRAVLCVGGRTASVPLYRCIIEGVGGRFAHHDGGEEENLAKLDSTLAAADLVICQTGCISHNAYWRVKDHCKRTGKQCVFVENTGTSSLKRALSEWQPDSAG